MHYEFEVGIQDENGLDVVDENKETFTVRRAIRRALLSGRAEAEQKLKNYDLFIKLRDATSSTDFSLTEVKSMRDTSIEVYPTLVAGQLAQFLDQKG